MSKSVKSNQSNQSNQVCLKGNNVSNGSNLGLSIKKVKSNKTEKKTKRISNTKQEFKKLYNDILTCLKMNIKNIEMIDIKDFRKLSDKEKSKGNKIVFRKWKNIILFKTQNWSEIQTIEGKDEKIICRNPNTSPQMLAQLLLKNNIGEVLIHSNTHKFGMYYGVCSYDKLFTLLDKNSNLYECIEESKPRKIYFDIDGRKDFLEDIKKDIYEILPNAKLSISGSIGMKKNEKYYSYHIIVNNYHFDDNKHQNTCGFKNWIMKISKKYNTEFDKNKRVIKNLDDGIYTRNRMMKFINQSKKCDNKRIQSIIADDLYKNHIITLIDENSINISDEFKKFIVKPKEEKFKVIEGNNEFTSLDFNFSHIQKFKGEQPYINLWNDKPEYLLNCIKTNKTKNRLGYNTEFLIALWFYSEGGGFSTFLNWVSQPWICESQHRIKWLRTWKKMKEYKKIKINRNHIKYILDRQYDGVTNLYLEDFKQTFLKPKDMDLIFDDKYLQLDMFENVDKKYFLFNVGMGGGKSYNTMEYLLKYNPERVLWITNRKTLARDILARLNKRNLDFKHYIDDRIFGYDLKDYNRLMIELESLNKLQCDYTKVIAEYDIIVMDEIESLFNVFKSDTTHGRNQEHYNNNFNVFKSLCKTSKKVFMMDAYISDRTTTFIKNLELEDLHKANIVDLEIDELIEYKTKISNYSLKDNTYIIGRKHNKIKRVVNIHSGFYGWYRNLTEELSQGKKIYVFYPYKTARGSVYKLSIEALGQDIRNLCNLKQEEVLVYHGASDSQKKKDLARVNEVWSKAKCIVTNSTISVGVSYENKDFDKVYIAYDDFISPRDVIQTSLRVRTPKESIIEFVKMPCMSHLLKQIGQTTAIKKPNSDQSKILNDLQSSLLLEENCKGVECLYFMMEQTGYEFGYNFRRNELDIKFREEFLARDKDRTAWDYDNIKKIKQDTAQEIRKKIFKDLATMEEQLQLDRFYNDRYFDNKDVKKYFFKRPKLRDGFSLLFNKDYENTSLSFVITRTNNFDLVDKDTKEKIPMYIKWNYNPLTKEQKETIKNELHFTDEYINRSDNQIKKDIIQFYFGIGCLDNFCKSDYYKLKKNSSGNWSNKFLQGKETYLAGMKKDFKEVNLLNNFIKSHSQSFDKKICLLDGDFKLGYKLENTELLWFKKNGKWDTSGELRKSKRRKLKK